MTELDTPLVSVLMTAYNREKYIAEAIRSVLASLYQNFELIIVDDCSQDNTVAIARQFEEKDKRIKLFVNGHNLGDYLNRNKAASYATGKYLKYLDSDDLMYPWCLDAMVMCMEKLPAAGFGLCGYQIQSEVAFPVLVQPAEAYRSFFYQNNYFLMGPSGSIIKREVFEQFGGFTGEKYIGDTDLWLRMGALLPVVLMPMDLIWWRRHEGQQMLEEIKDISIKNIRYKRSRELVEQANCPLSKSQKEAVIKNLENLRARDILFKLLLKFKIDAAFSAIKQCNFTLLDLRKALRRNTYP